MSSSEVIYSRESKSKDMGSEEILVFFRPLYALISHTLLLCCQMEDKYSNKKVTNVGMPIIATKLIIYSIIFSIIMVLAIITMIHTHNGDAH